MEHVDSSGQENNGSRNEQGLRKCVDFELEKEELTEIENERVFGNEKNKLVIQETGKIVMEFLMKHFEELFSYDYTKTMEDSLDKIKEGNKVWHDLCRDCDKQIKDIQSNIKAVDKQEFQLDETHTYMIGKYGPVIKQTLDDDKVVFLKGFSEQVHNLEPLNELDGDQSDIMSLYEKSDCNEKQGKEIEEICSNLLIETFQLFFIHKMHEATYNQNHQEFNCELSKL